MRKFRRGARTCKHAQCVTKLDRNDKARIIFCAEQRELRSKEPGKKDGIVGQSGLRVLRCLLHQFHNASTGHCHPGYTAIEVRTGLCRQAVATGIKRLEQAGIITVLRRIRRDGWREVQDGVGALEDEERDGPNPSSLCDDPLAPDGVRASSRQHPVQDRHADGSLGLLSSEAAGAQPRSDQRLVPTHCRFNQ